MSDLTDRQREVHAFIVRYGREHARWPTIRDIGNHFGWSAPNAALCHLKALETKGYIERPHDGTSRGIRVLRGLDGEPLNPTTGLTRVEVFEAITVLTDNTALALQWTDQLCRRWGIE